MPALRFDSNLLSGSSVGCDEFRVAFSSIRLVFVRDLETGSDAGSRRENLVPRTLKSFFQFEPVDQTARQSIVILKNKQVVSQVEELLR